MVPNTTQSERLTTAQQNCLKTIYVLREQNVEPTVSAVAARLGISIPGALQLTTKLIRKKLLTRDKQTLKLTPAGETIAVGLVRRHRLWEYFLTHCLGIDWEHIHEIAEQLEHVDSSLLVERLEAFLGYPRFDPHGDPIPDRHGNTEHRPLIPLSEMAEGTECVVAAVRQQTPSFLQMLRELNIGLGTSLRLLKRYSYDRSVLVEVEGRKVMLSESAARAILVKKATVT